MNLPVEDIQSVDESIVHRLYETVPYPADDGQIMHEGAPLPPLAWISGVRPQCQLNSPDARILVAGCGSGAEAFRYQLACPNATVVGVDFSQRSIRLAQQITDQHGFERISFAVADLTKSDWTEDHEPFDFVSLHGVIDYIPDAQAAFSTLASVLKPNGCLYAGVNGPGHHNILYKRAFEHFGLQPDQTGFTDIDRDRLRAIETLMVVDAGDSVADESETYLASDVFTSQNHSKSINQWLEVTSAAGLQLTSSLDLALLLPRCEPKILRHFLHLDRPTLSRIAADVQHKSFMRLLFTKEMAIEPPWTDIDALAVWRPTSLPSFRKDAPKLKGLWDQLQRTVINNPGLGKQAMFLSPAACEFIARCDGASTAIDIWAGLPQPANWSELVLPLFSSFQAGIVSWAAPAE